jgi:hypothetical protein
MGRVYAYLHGRHAAHFTYENQNIMSKATSKEIIRRMADGRALQSTPTGGYRQYSSHFGWQSVHEGSIKSLLAKGVILVDRIQGTTVYYKLAERLTQDIEL